MINKKILSLIIVCVAATSLIAYNANAAKQTSGSTTKKIISEVRNNFEKKDVRNESLVQKERENDDDNIGSSTEREREDRASSTSIFKIEKNKKKEVLKKMKVNEFEIRKNALEKELNKSLESINKLRNQINDRINKIEADPNKPVNRDMTVAKAALAIADSKIASAKTAVELFNSTKFATSTATSTKNKITELNLEKPRKIGDAAIKAVKDARDSLKTVARAIAQSMGLRNDDDSDDHRTSTSTNAISTSTNSTSTKER